MTRSRVSSTALIVLLTAALVGCVPGALDPNPSGTATPAPSATPVDPNPSDFEPEPTEPPTTEPVGGDIGVPCDEILTAQQVYDLNPELLATANPEVGLLPGFQGIVDAGGVTCAWQHVTSRDVLLVGVVAAENAPSGAFDSGSLPAIGETSGNWFVMIASEYLEGADALGYQLIDDVVGNLS